MRLLISCLMILSILACCFAAPAPVPKKSTVAPREIDFTPLLGSGSFTMQLSFQFADGTKISNVEVDSDGVTDDAKSLILCLQSSLMQMTLAVDGDNKLIIKNLNGSGVVDVQANVIGFPKTKQPKIRVIEENK